MKPNINKLQSECDEFNANIKIGDEVILTRPDGSELNTRVGYEASVLSGHTAIVWLDGIRGCVKLSHVRKAP